MGQELESIEFEEEGLKASIGSVGEVDERMVRGIADVPSSSDLTQSILSLVVRRKYDYAAEELQGYSECKKEYPDLDAMSKTAISHCIDLVRAIETKRSIPGVENLSMSKRQQIYDSVMAQFNELKATLKRIEKMEYNVRMVDLRSTVIVVKVFSCCVFAIAALAFFLDIYNGLYYTAAVVLEEGFHAAINWFFDLLNL